MVHETPLPNDGLPGRLRGRVEQQVDAIAGSANKVISGVVDSSFGILRSFLPNNADPVDPSADNMQPTAPWNSVRPGFGLLRRETGFSIASIAASLPGSRDRAKSVNSVEETGRPLVAVSRPNSVRSMHVNEENPSSVNSEEDEDDEEGNDEEEDDEGGKDEDEEAVGEPDARSIKSFESMMSGKSRDRRGASARKSLSDRLAHMSGLAALKVCTLFL